MIAPSQFNSLERQGKMESKRIQESIHDVEEDFQSLSIHGFPKIVSTKSRRIRIFWLLLFILAVVGLSATAFSSISGYFSRNITIKTAFKKAYLITLPAITFCHTDFVFDNSSHVPVPQIFSRNCTNQDAVHFPNKANELSFRIGCKMFFGVKSNGVFMINQNVDRAFQFPHSFTFVPNRYPCFTFNTNSLAVQKLEGEENGIHMILYEPEFVKSAEQMSSGMVEEGILETSRGISLWVHDPKQTIPFGTGVRLLPGFQTQVSIQKNIIKRLPYPYPSKCAEGGADYRSIYPGKNTIRMCYASCFHKTIYDSCGGVLPAVKTFMQPTKYPIWSSNAKFWPCFTQALPRIGYTNCECRPHCYEEDYKLSVSRSLWPRNVKAPFIKRLVDNAEGKRSLNLSTEEIRNRLIKVSLYYEDFMETIYEEKPLHELLDIASNLGGQMGLFLGASILSLVEIVALLIEVIKRKISARGKIRNTGDPAKCNGHYNA